MTSQSASFGLAKVILVGEHAVVYGHPALAGAIDRRVTCQLIAGAGRLQLRCAPWELDVGVDQDHPVGHALRIIADKLGYSGGGTIETLAEIPARAGLGSSAALCVALVRCLSARAGRSLDDQGIEELANLGETCFHERPSGVDVALATRGGLGIFRRDEGLRQLSSGRVELAIALSGQPRNTAALVNAVAEGRRQRPGETDTALAELGELATRAASALEGADEQSLGAIFCRAQALLASLGLSTPVLDGLIDIATRAGASGAKLTGAGGGGAVIAVGTDLERIVTEWRYAGFDGFTTVVGATP